MRSAPAMTLPSSRCAIALAIALCFAAAACGGKSTDAGPAPCALKTPPAGAAPISLKLSRIELGDRDASGQPSKEAWRRLGYDLDGLCTTPTESRSCTRDVGQPQADGPGGIDNGFGAAILPMFIPIYGKPSLAWSGSSFLQVDAEGSGMLFLVDTKGVMFRVPLRDARVASSDGRSGTLAAVIPVSALVETIRADLGALGPLYCTGESVDSLATTIRGAADISTAGTHDPQASCDGISIGLTFEGAPDDPPAVPPRVPCGR